MLRKTGTVLSILLAMFNYAGGVSAVICVGANGLISMEMSIQNRCFCSEDAPGESSNTPNSFEENCRDIPLASSVVAAGEKDLASVVKPCFYAIQDELVFSSDFPQAHLESCSFPHLESVVLTI